MAEDCGCDKPRMRGVPTQIDPTRRKQWRVFFPNGRTRDYFTSMDADTAIERNVDKTTGARGRKQRLSS